MAASRASWPLGARLRPLVRVPRRRDAPVRARRSTTTTTRCCRREPRGGLPPERRPRRPRDRVPRRPARGRRRPTASSCYFATGACHSPHHAPAEWIERYRGQFDDGWDAWRERDLRPPARRSACCPAAHAALAAAALGAGVGRRSTAEDQRGRGPLHGVLRRVPLLHRRPDRPAPRVPRADRRPRQHPHRRWSPTTAPAPKAAPKGSINDVRLLNGDPAGRRELRARIDEIGGPTAHNNYPWGWTMAGNTPFKRWKREVHEGGVADPCIVQLARPAAASPAGGIRRQFAHADRRAADRARPGRHRGARRRSTASPQSRDRRHELRRRARRRRRRAPEHARDPVLRDARVARASTTTAGRR